MQHCGGGGLARFDQDYWLWPLPPLGRLAFVTEWPSQGVAVTRVDVDTSQILDASTRATTLWEPAGAGGGGGHMHGSAQFVSARTERRDLST